MYGLLGGMHAEFSSNSEVRKALVYAGGIMSYALDSKASSASTRSADFNHFVVFDPYNTIACHDFEVRPRRNPDRAGWRPVLQ